MNKLFGLNQNFLGTSIFSLIKQPYYYVFLIRGYANFSVDFIKYKCSGNTLIFISPFQFFEFNGIEVNVISEVHFHGDFYCIEYHKKEVACNGVLFNNIYQQPYVSISDNLFEDINLYLCKMQEIKDPEDEYDTSILRSYLQLVLALSSKVKQQQISVNNKLQPNFLDIANFQPLLEKYYLQQRNIAFYASLFGLSSNSFSKKIRKYFNKSPSKLLQERIVLEAKKLLHLTNKPIKLVAAELNFQDEYYFSRFFKKLVGVSPKQFRDNVGISIVSNLSI